MKVVLQVGIKCFLRLFSNVLVVFNNKTKMWIYEMALSKVSSSSVYYLSMVDYSQKQLYNALFILGVKKLPVPFSLANLMTV